MDTSRLFRIANRIHLLLLKELGQGIDVQRLLNERLYARDVLLVCDAQPGTDLASLALHFRHTRAALAASAPRPGSAPAETPGSFSHTLSSLFGHDFEIAQPPATGQPAFADSAFRLKPRARPVAGHPPPRSRLSPARWIGL
ncbi:hypothetical protein ACPOLB_12955 [Rubrivivax sp. RP6-9]|uniref:hypothetical protein n=1 Tax=Rubrivivax sp. RP6-9 TaxID=3415750 RepID=UPI003CC5C4AF